MPAAQDLCGMTLKERYRLTELLGAGGMGQVYAGIDQTLDRPVAVKVLLNKLADDSRFQQRFFREAKAASKIQHPNVVQILDFGETPDGSVFYAMEYLDGCDLATLLRAEGTLPWSRARNILLQIVKALAATHERQIIHRDIKPANFYVLDARGHHDFIKLLDFGIAKASGDADTDVSMGASLTGAGEVMGTAKYMAPEQAYGHSNDLRIDIYAVGVVAYQLLTGAVPFTGSSAFEILKKHVEQQPRPLREFDPRIPPEVEAIVLRAMAKDANDRHASMDELGLAFAGVPARARGLPVATPPTPVARERDVTVPAGSGSARGAAANRARPAASWAPPGSSTAVVATTPRKPTSVTYGEMGQRDASARQQRAASTMPRPVATPVPAGSAVPTPSSDPGGGLPDDPSTGATGRAVGLREERIATVPSVGAITGVETNPQVVLSSTPVPEQRGGAGALLAGLVGLLVLAGLGTVGFLAFGDGDAVPASALAPTSAPKSPPKEEPVEVEAEPAAVAGEAEAEPPAEGEASAAPASPTEQPEVVEAVAEPEPPVEAPPARKKPSRSKPRKSQAEAKPKGPGEDAQVSARLAKSVARKCKSHGDGRTVTVDLIVSSKGKVVTRSVHGVSPELRSCLLAGVGGATFREGGTRTVSVKVAL